MKVSADPTLHFDWSPLRRRRDLLLAQSDRYMHSDFPISEADRELVKVYRQQLRDMFVGVTPDTVEFPTWPLRAS